MVEDAGKSIIASMEGEQITKYVFKKKNQVKLMGAKIFSDGEEIVSCGSPAAVSETLNNIKQLQVKSC